VDNVLQLFVDHGYTIATFIISALVVEFEFEYINEDGKKTKRFKISSRFAKK